MADGALSGGCAGCHEPSHRLHETVQEGDPVCTECHTANEFGFIVPVTAKRNDSTTSGTCACLADTVGDPRGAPAVVIPPAIPFTILG